MNRAPSEDLHNPLLAFQDIAFFEEIQKKASRDQTREYYDDLEGRQTWTEVSEDSQPKLSTDPFFTQHIIALTKHVLNLFQGSLLFSGKGSKFDIARSKFISRFIITGLG